MTSLIEIDSLEEFFDSSTDLIVISDTNEKCLFVNKAGANQLKLKKSDLIGTQLYDTKKKLEWDDMAYKAIQTAESKVVAERAQVTSRLPGFRDDHGKLFSGFSIKNPLLGQDGKVKAIATRIRVIPSAPLTDSFVFKVSKAIDSQKERSLAKNTLESLQVLSFFNETPTNSETLTLLALSEFRTVESASNNVRLKQETIRKYKKNLQSKCNININTVVGIITQMSLTKKAAMDEQENET